MEETLLYVHQYKKSLCQPLAQPISSLLITHLSSFRIHLKKIKKATIYNTQSQFILLSKAFYSLFFFGKESSLLTNDGVSASSPFRTQGLLTSTLPFSFSFPVVMGITLRGMNLLSRCKLSSLRVDSILEWLRHPRRSVQLSNFVKMPLEHWGVPFIYYSSVFCDMSANVSNSPQT